jgi:hypothetical protein
MYIGTIRAKKLMATLAFWARSLSPDSRRSKDPKTAKREKEGERGRGRV